jgi:Rrf2 family protein
MNFTKTTAYSLLVLSHLAKHDKERLSASELFRQLGIPYSYLRTILLDLSKQGLIRGTKGRNGGFILARAGADIYLSEIINTTEGPDNLNSCIMGFETCPFDKGCFLHPVWTRMRSEINELLAKTSLADLLNIFDKS